jgi:carbonic anhydrase
MSSFRRWAPLASLRKATSGFPTNRPAAKDKSKNRRAALAKNQSPFAIILACSDSRVVPETLFDQGLGDLFVIRLAGNVADPAAIGSIEYAFEYLHVPLIVVLGHEECGAVKAAVDGSEIPDNLGWLVHQVHTGPAATNDQKPTLDSAVRTNVIHQAKELRLRSAPLRELAATERIKVVAGVYSLKSGKVAWLQGSEDKKAAGR